MGRIIAFDIGDKRVGVAISDPFGEMALPVETYWRKGFEKDIDYLIKLAKDKYAEVIVCGLPVNFDGSRSEQTDKTEEFIAKLKEKTDIHCILQKGRIAENKRILSMRFFIYDNISFKPNKYLESLIHL